MPLVRDKTDRGEQDMTKIEEKGKTVYPRILRCKLGLLKTAVCLQVTLLNESEMERLRAIGPQQFSEYLYPETGGTWHYLSQRKRDDKF